MQPFPIHSEHKESPAVATPARKSELSRSRGSVRYTAQRKSRKRHHILLAVLAAAAAVLVIGGVAFTRYEADISEHLSSGITPELQAELSSTKDVSEPFYMLLLGIDKNADRTEAWGDSDSNFRSDTIILARIDPQQKKIALVSIARDTMVDMGDHGRQKINAAYALGGPSYAVQVVEQYAGVDISHYAEVDFETLTKIVDAVGGVEVNVPVDVVDPLAGADIQAGTQTLDGTQALALCRSRHAYDAYGAGDFYRAANQRVVISAVLKKVLAADPLTIADTVSTLADGVTCDLDASQIVSLAIQMRGLDAAHDISSGLNPTYGKMINGISYQISDDEAWQQMMDRVRAGESPYENAEDDPTAGVASSAADGS